MAAANMYVKHDAAGGGNGLSWAQAWTIAEMKTDIEANAEAGDKYYIMEGGYSPANTIDCSGRDGSSTAMISIIGVKAETINEPPLSSDWAYESDMPVLAFGANSLIVGANYDIKGLNITSTASSALSSETESINSHCKVTNSSGTSDRNAISLDTYGRASRCEAISTNGHAVGLTSYSQAISCYLHDSKNGVRSGGGSIKSVVMFCTIDTCSVYGILNYSYGAIFSHNTVYNCTTGFYGSLGRTTTAMNNFFISNGTGAGYNTEHKNNFFDYNHYYGNSTTTSNITEGANSDESQSVDPQLTDPANGDFSIGNDALKGTGFPGTFPGGLSTGYLSIGAVQPDPSGAAGGGLNLFNSIVR